VRRIDFTGGETLEGERHLLGRYARAIVGDADQLAAGILHVDADVLCPGVEGVLDQFFDHARRALDDFAGGDLLPEVGRENMDFHRGS
jgi:hypothetical protein